MSAPGNQAVSLRERNGDGSTGGSNVYGYPGMDTTNGATDFQDIDTAALLESLTNGDFETSPRPAPRNDQFDSLLQAAASAGGQDDAQFGRSQQDGGRAEYPLFNRSFTPDPNSTSKRKRSSDGRSSTTKRRRKRSLIEDEDQLAREREIWGPDDDEENASASYEAQAAANSDARAVGLNSAVALFRKPSEASKKYTRPPMSKLFLSLDLPADVFLTLQAAAKAYMLDPNHPDRMECVGARGKGDTDMVKLKLFACVKSFLIDEGWGERCFGLAAKGSDRRKLKWPLNKSKIITSVTPLLRRVITNERQRQYAVESRQRKLSMAESDSGQRGGENLASGLGSPAVSHHSPHEDSVVDPKLNEYHYNPGSSFQHQGDATTNGEGHSYPEDYGIKYHVNILHDNRRVKPKVIIPHHSCPGFSSLVQYIHSLLEDTNHHLCQVKVMGTDGLVVVDDEDGWAEVVSSIEQTEWMDGEVRCLVEVDNQS